MDKIYHKALIFRGKTLRMALWWNGGTPVISVMTSDVKERGKMIRDSFADYHPFNNFLYFPFVQARPSPSHNMK